MQTLWSAGLAVLLAGSITFAESAKAKGKAAGQVLAGGAYSAQVKGIVCGGCGEAIRETLEQIDGIEKVSVDQEKKTVQFQVRKNTKVNLALVQKALQASADKMGMGADYQLRGLKKASRSY